MTLSPSGIWLTFQVTFTELFIASSLFASIAYKRGWRSIALGAFFGALIVCILAIVLGISISKVPIPILDWISATLLLGFGFYIFYEFWTGLKRKGAGEPKPDASLDSLSNHLEMPINSSGVGLAAWAMLAEGLEILIVWLAVSVKSGMATASLGMGVGLLVIAGIGMLLGKSGIFSKVPAHYLDGFAAVMVTGYGLYFLSEALAHR